MGFFEKAFARWTGVQKYVDDYGGVVEADKVTATACEVLLDGHLFKGVRVNVYESKEAVQGDEFSVVLRDDQGKTLAQLFFTPEEFLRVRMLLFKPLTAP
jgi:hypothetical protein